MTKMLAALFAALLASLALIVAFSPLAHSQVADKRDAGPASRDNGFPSHYQDSKGLRMDLCLDQNKLCLLENPNPGPISFPDNFGPEAFWWNAETTMPTRNGGQALLVMASEAAFGGADEATRDGDQVTFGRVRIRVDNLVPGATYKVTYPYGVKTFRNVAGGRRGINFTQDIGCVALPCNFNLALKSRVYQSFLTWDPAVAPAPPKGYIGDPRVKHQVTGSPTGNNFFRIEGPNVGGPGVNKIQKSVFSVMGKIAGRAPSTLTLKASSSTVKLGKGTQLSGKLSSFRRPVAGSRIVITRKPAGATKFSKLTGGKLTTRADGTFLLRGVKPRKNTLYKASFGGKAPVANSTGYKSSRNGEFVRVTR